MSDRTEARAPLVAGDRLGRYRIEREVGVGSVGTVYRASPPGGGGPVAIKVLLPGHRRGAERIAAEAGALGKLRHPNVAELIEVLSDEETGGRGVALVTRFIDGPSLEQVLRERPEGLTDPFRIGLARAVAGALGAAHRVGLIHRDLKPANVLLPDPSRPESATVVDFGLAGQLSEQSGVTSAGELFGSVPYMSPEQVTAKPQDRRTDIWGLGVLLYELFLGGLPFEGKSFAATALQVVRDEPTGLGGGSPIEPVVRRCLRKDPDERFQSMAELEAALDEVGRAAGWLEQPATNGAEAAKKRSRGGSSLVDGDDAEELAARPAGTVASSGQSVVESSVESPAPAWTPSGRGAGRPGGHGLAPTGPSMRTASDSSDAAPRASASPDTAAAVAKIALVVLATGMLAAVGIWLFATGAAPPTAAARTASALVVGGLCGVAVAWTIRTLAARTGAVEGRVGAAQAKAGSRLSLTDSLALVVDEIVEQVEGDPAGKAMAVSLGIAVDRYRGASGGGDQNEAFEHTLKLLELLDRRLGRVEKPWFVRYEKLFALLATLSGVVLAWIALGTKLLGGARPAP